MHSAHCTNFGRERNVALHRLFVDAVLRKYFATPGSCEESTLIDEEFGLYDEATSNRTRSEIYAEAFPATT